MKSLVAAIQMNSGSDVKKNLQQAERLITEAAAEGAQIIVLPEMFAIIGETESDKVHAAEKLGSGPIQDFLAQQAKQHKIWIVGGTIPLMTKSPNKIAAACLVYDSQGKVVARYDKIHMFDVNVGEQKYHESKTTEPGKKIVLVDTPFGKLGICVCYDIRSQALTSSLVEQGAEIIVIPTAFTQKTGAAHWEVLVRALAIHSQCYVVAACEEGEHPNGRHTYGHSMIVDPWGSVLARLEKGMGLVAANIDLDFLKEVRNNMPLQSLKSIKN